MVWEKGKSTMHLRIGAVRVREVFGEVPLLTTIGNRETPRFVSPFLKLLGKYGEC